MTGGHPCGALGFDVSKPDPRARCGRRVPTEMDWNLNGGVPFGNSI